VIALVRRADIERQPCQNWWPPIGVEFDAAVDGTNWARADAAEHDAFAGDARTQQHSAGHDTEPFGYRTGNGRFDTLVHHITEQGEAVGFVKIKVWLADVEDSGDELD